MTRRDGIIAALGVVAASAMPAHLQSQELTMHVGPVKYALLELNLDTFTKAEGPYSVVLSVIYKGEAVKITAAEIWEALNNKESK